MTASVLALSCFDYNLRMWALLQHAFKSPQQQGGIGFGNIPETDTEEYIIGDGKKCKYRNDSGYLFV